MTKVRMFCDWDNDSAGLIEALNRQTIPTDEHTVEFTAGDDYDYAVIFNYALAGVEVPPEKRIGLVLEPVEILDSMYPGWRDFDISQAAKYYSFTPIDGYELAYGIGFATAPVRYFYPDPPRPHRVCMVVSNKTYTAYQIKRREVFQALLKSDLNIHFFGRGMVQTGDPRIMGEIPPMRKYEVFANYDMVIDFENDPFAVTDKFYDAVIAGCTPITNCRLGLPGMYNIDFGASVDEIVRRIGAAIQSGPLDVSQLHFEVTSGKLSLSTWINEKVRELESASTGS